MKSSVVGMAVWSPKILDVMIRTVEDHVRWASLYNLKNAEDQLEDLKVRGKKRVALINTVSLYKKLKPKLSGVISVVCDTPVNLAKDKIKPVDYAFGKPQFVRSKFSKLFGVPKPKEQKLLERLDANFK